MNIYDIAELAGVSIATVSRVINDSPNVAEKTKLRVRRIMEEHGYIPNGLGLSQMKTIGLICPDLADGYIAKSVAFLERSLRGYGYDCILCCSGRGYGDCQIAVGELLQRRVDALVLIGSCYADSDPDSEKLNYLREAARQVPVFIINGYVRGENICCALCDDFEASYSAVMEMIRSGRRKILFLGDDRTVSAGLKRRGYEAAHAEAGLPVRKELEIYIPNEINGARDYLLKCGLGDIDGVFSTEDGLAAGALKYAKRRGLSVPGQLCITGYNNSEVSVCCDPELSSVDSRGERLCRIVIDSMRLRLGGREIKNKVYAKGYLVRRETTDF